VVPSPYNKLKQKLDTLYDQYNKRSYVDPDPLLFLYDYPAVRDREIAGLVASCLAYGRVAMIMRTVGAVLGTMGDSPYRFVSNTTPHELDQLFKGFRYRFASQSHLTALLMGIQGILREFGSIEACFVSGVSDKGKKQGDLSQGLGGIYRSVAEAGNPGHLLADPFKTSACKRSHLYLRWMVRQDKVDPGGWDQVSKRDLVVPIDTHMYRIGGFLRFTHRKSADKICAMDITKGFREISPQDPVKYDFALTRFGIREQFDAHALERFLTPNKDQDTYEQSIQRI
jgi:uncharacterized protein (TIGR02757 family)